MSKIKVNEIEAQSGSTITIPTGQNLVVTDGLATSSLPTVPVSKGGTGLTSLGSAGQALKVNSGGTALEFGAVSTGTPVVETVINGQTFSTGTTFAYVDITGLNVTITPTSATSKIALFMRVEGSVDVHHYFWHLRLQRSIGGGAYTNPANSVSNQDAGGFTNMTRSQYDSNGTSVQNTFYLDDSHNTTSAITYKLQVYSGSGGTWYLNRNASNANNSGNWQRGAFSKIMAIEFKQ